MVEISSGIHQVDGVNANCYIVIESDGSLTLIDSGMSKNGRRILDYIQGSLSKSRSDLKVIILTHAHVDHIRGALAIKNATGAKVAIHEEDADYLSGKRTLPSPRGAIGLLFKIVSPFFRSPKFEPDVRLKENDAASLSLLVVHTPGHTPGSISLLSKDRKLIFVGDAIINRGSVLQGPPKQFTVDYPKAVKSIEKISSFAFDLLSSGHGPIVKTGGTEKTRQLLVSLEG